MENTMHVVYFLKLREKAKDVKCIWVCHAVLTGDYKFAFSDHLSICVSQQYVTNTTNLRDPKSPSKCLKSPTILYQMNLMLHRHLILHNVFFQTLGLSSLNLHKYTKNHYQSQKL